MGTEGIPDDTWEDGVFSTMNVVIARRTGLHPEEADYVEDKDEATKPPKLTKKVQFSIPPTAEEKRRLAKHVLPYEYRFHYRWIAAALAKKAAVPTPHFAAKPVAPSKPVVSNDDEDEDEDDSPANNIPRSKMSRAERKKLRRQERDDD